MLGNCHPIQFGADGALVIPEGLCRMLGFTDRLQVVGLGDHVEIWSEAG